MTCLIKTFSKLLSNKFCLTLRVLTVNISIFLSFACGCVFVSVYMCEREKDSLWKRKEKGEAIREREGES